MNKTWLLAAAVFLSTTSIGSADCPADADRVGKTLAAIKGPGFMPVLKIGSPTSATAKPFDKRGFVVAVTKDGKHVVQGQVFASAKETEQFLDAMWKRGLEAHAMEGPGGKAQLPLYIWADKDAPAKHVAALVAVANKVGGDQFLIRLLVTGKEKVPAPTGGAVAIAAKMPAKEPEGTKYLVDQIKPVMAGCSQVITVVASTTVGDSMSKKHDLSVTVPKALKDCGCKVTKMDVFEWGIAEWWGAQGAALAWIDMPKLGAAEAQPIGKLVK